MDIKSLGSLAPPRHVTLLKLSPLGCNLGTALLIGKKRGTNVYGLRSDMPTIPAAELPDGFTRVRLSSGELDIQRSPEQVTARRDAGATQEVTGPFGDALGFIRNKAVQVKVLGFLHCSGL